jgi:hypothetical protein
VFPFRSMVRTALVGTIGAGDAMGRHFTQLHLSLGARGGVKGRSRGEYCDAEDEEADRNDDAGRRQPVAAFSGLFDLRLRHEPENHAERRAQEGADQ